MQILALSPYHGGSHRAFHDGWSARSRHAWTLLHLPAHHWKWRMRHAAIDFAEQSAHLAAQGARFDMIFCTDMLNLADFRSLAPKQLRDLPCVAYFHENQFTYPVTRDDPRDMHLAFNNVMTALAADAVWFNSHYHMHDFLAAARDVLKRMPDCQPLSALDRIEAKAQVQHPGAAVASRDEEMTAQKNDGALHIVWAARWEHDKNPAQFFDAMYQLDDAKLPFRVSVIGQSFRDTPKVFEEASSRLRERIAYWGFQSSREAYERVLREADVFVSTAHHEFFGIAAVEAMLAGCGVLLPNRLAYPELLSPMRDAAARNLYDGSTESLCDALRNLIEVKRNSGRLRDDDDDDGALRRCAQRFAWDVRAGAMDDALDATVRAQLRG